MKYFTEYDFYFRSNNKNILIHADRRIIVHYINQLLNIQSHAGEEKKYLSSEYILGSQFGQRKFKNTDTS